jgi:hypothetical protein
MNQLKHAAYFQSRFENRLTIKGLNDYRDVNIMDFYRCNMIAKYNLFYILVTFEANNRWWWRACRTGCACDNPMD